MRITKFYFMLLTIVATTVFVGCSDDDDSDTMAQVSVDGTVLFDDGDDFNGDVDGDFTGNGGSATRTFLWMNNLTTADYNSDITASAEGTFNMLVLDADGNTVLNRSLDGASEPDSFSGVTDAGASGIWSVTISLSSFNGDGSFSLSEGN
ncbi:MULTISPECIES: hypothetical protein [Flavobacteriaceae]|jgi:hypothetical protein|uniref:Uncharacterized protein n=1 Tax=Leeuwenhoekiella blandensis (strain CECT 7118 / CCUG 51940 / KCTC 22103 / MED217) TaxID=398720 RepID=A3XKG8_LEEBM|nr:MULTISPECIES: hypothetical protein [Flavobacteriaceae]EAQ49960.1 hypothetical protein MED217_02380 [Leeuwenhoekiella blandensis MED217]MDH7912026.1 hypothetical protein [Winogradskyella sp. SYSU M77433]